METTLIERHFRLFADPATDFSVSAGSDATAVRMIRNGSERTYNIRQNGSVVGRHNSVEYANIASVFASGDFADIRELRATQRRLLLNRESQHRLDPVGSMEEADKSWSLSIDAFRAAVSYQQTPSIRLVLLDGPAGMGKTSLIERVSLERSEPSCPQPPLLHIVSSGKRLTSLNQELAHTTQVLRAKFTFDQVPVLAYWGVLQVAIDGFDELVDDAGYKDAWSALREFLGQVGRGGPVILAGRDTFFDQQGFRDRISERIPGLELTTARLQTVSKASARDFLRASGWTEADLGTADQRDWFRTGSYQLRPFFLAQIASATGWGELQKAFGSPQAFIVSRFVGREAAIISRMVTISKESAEEALWDFYSAIVEDMALQETDYVDVGYLALACETAFADRLSSEDLRKLVHKAGSMGLLEADGVGELRRFPHSEIQSQFLARTLCDGLLKPGYCPPFVRRGTISLSLAEAFSDALVRQTPERIAAIVGKLVSLHDDEPFSDRVVGNSISLIFSCLSRQFSAAAVELKGGLTAAVRAIGVLEPAIFSDVSILQLDARGADLGSVYFEACSVGVLTADNNTRFGRKVPVISSMLLVEYSGAAKTVRVPEQIAAWLANHSVQATQDDESRLELVRYFDKVCRKFLRQHQIRNGENDESYFLIADAMWHEILPIVGDRLMFVGDGKPASGPNDGFYRLRSPEALLNPPPDDTAAIEIRRRIIARARELAAK